jgi:hypothetical protein
LKEQKVGKVVVLIGLALTIFLMSFVEGFGDNRLNGYKLEPGSDTLSYLFLGHTYNFKPTGPRVDPRVVQIDKSQFSRIWLGGDICSEAFLEKSTVLHMDSVFSLSSSTTQYALGNHDVRNGNIEWYSEICNKPTYNVYSANGAVSICMNSMLNPGLCTQLNSQYKMIKSVCDTITDSKFLFIFHHAGLWENVPGLPPSATYCHSNFNYWVANCDSASTYYENTIYPLLKQVRNKGIKVFCIMGDSGTGTLKGFHTENADSIHFFASGLYNSKFSHDSILYNAQIPDSALIFTHDLVNQQMDWKFQSIDSLLNE